MVVMESDVILPAMWVSGKADHYDTVLKAMIEQAPEHWDMIKLDVGLRGRWANDGIAKEDRKKPVVQLQIPELEEQEPAAVRAVQGSGLGSRAAATTSLGPLRLEDPEGHQERGLGMVDASADVRRPPPQLLQPCVSVPPWLML